MTVDELTTVATTYALAQFSGPDGIAGPSPGLENAAATAFNLADSASGKAGAVVTDQDNGAKNETLATLGTLANLVSLCAAAQSADAVTCCGWPRHREAPPRGTRCRPRQPRPKSDARRRQRSWHWHGRRPFTSPSSTRRPPPGSWRCCTPKPTSTLPDASRSTRRETSGRATIGSPGRRTEARSSPCSTPRASRRSGSPIEGGGMKAGAWGIAITPGGTVWMRASAARRWHSTRRRATPLSPATGWTNGHLNHPQGIAIDQKGNVWIANNYGPESAPGQGNVVVYPGGDPAKAFTISGGGLNHPFAVQIDGYGRAWVTNAGLGGARLVNTRAAILAGKFGGSVTVIGTRLQARRLLADPEQFLQVAARPRHRLQEQRLGHELLQQHGDRDPAQRRRRWRVPAARDGSPVVGGHRRVGSVWVAGFATPHVWQLCGAESAACPPGHPPGASCPRRLGIPEHGVPALHVDSARPVRQRLAEQQLVPAQPAGRRRGNRGDRRRCHTGMHPAHTGTGSALLCDRRRVPPDRDATGGRHACLFCHPGRRRGQRQPAGQDAGLGMGCDRRRACRAGSLRRAVLPPALCQVVTCSP